MISDGSFAAPAVAARPQALNIDRSWLIWAPLLCIWLCMFSSYSPMGRDEQITFGATDVLAVYKIAARAFLLLALGGTLFAMRNRDAIQCVKSLGMWWVFCGWAVISTLWSPLKSVTLGQSAGFIVLVLFAAQLAVLCRDRKTVSRVLWHLAVSLLLLGCWLLAARIFAPDLGSLGRESSGLFHSTNAAATASLGLVVVFGGWLCFGFTWSRWLVLPALVIHTAVLVFATNRTALALTPPLVCCLCFLAAPPVWRWTGVVAICVAGALYVAIDPGFSLVDNSIDALVDFSTRGQSAQQLAALSGREEMWAIMWESFELSPWVGHGYFVSSETGELYVWAISSNWTAHNFWLQVLVTTGIVGALFIAAALAVYVVGLIRGLAKGWLDARLALFAATILLWQFFWGLTNETFVGPVQPESVVFFAVLGITLAQLSRGRETHENSALSQPLSAARRRGSGLSR